jgi:beta-lactamase regulating signal transducer with metallopeptidase domain
MWFNGSLASLGTGITYLLQVVCYYLATRLICALVRNARIRVRLWGCFLFLAVGSWVSLWIPIRADGVIHDSVRSLPSLSRGSLHVALPVADVLASYLDKLASLAAELYILSLLISAVYLILQSGRLKAVLRRTQSPSQQLRLRFQRLCLELGIASCELRLSEELSSPATCYWWRSHVLLPADLPPQLDDDQLEDVLRHELLHVKRKDYLWDRLADVGCRMVFFHPLAWLGYRHLRWERELACDHAVVRECTEARLRYAECLTMLARRFMERKIVSPGIRMFSSESLLAVRVRSLLREPPLDSVSHTVARTGLAAIVATIGLLLTSGVGLSLYSPIHVARFLTDRSVGSGRAHKKASGTRRGFASKATNRGAPVLAHDEIPKPPEILSDLLPKALPALSASPAADESMGTDFPSLKGDNKLPNSRSVWDESPAPLATAPKWRTLAVRAITGGLGVAAGRVGDDDDDDGPRRRGR